ncbi:hypothetical protein PIIN_02030 [Serendipita indica DSM 11827]|uniref:ARM repeat-containing protein n=1 Tax=Serendipita indica (strain DSM 11827) TaxID=1109443 RepID=G4TA44_SERID|nr:hypothetical protein PIIN_02030 [Serendipita indica DSM 11827]
MLRHSGSPLVLCRLLLGRLRHSAVPERLEFQRTHGPAHVTQIVYGSLKSEPSDQSSGHGHATANYASSPPPSTGDQHIPSIVTKPATPLNTRPGSPIDAPWKSQSERRSRPSSPAAHPSSPAQMRSSPKMDDPRRSSTTVEATRRTDSQLLSTTLANIPQRVDSPTLADATSQSTPPRSPVLSPSPRLLSGSPRRDRSPAFRSGSPLAQSISPVPGAISESGNGILSPRLSPVPSPATSPGIERSNPLSPNLLSVSLPTRVDEMDYSSDSGDTTVPVPAQSGGDYFTDSGSDSTPTGSSPQVPDGQDSPIVHSPHIFSISERSEESEDDDPVIVDHEMGQFDEDQQQAMFLDDEGLSALEKIYLFSRSTYAFHRSYISKQLPFLIREVTPAEAVDYVCPLLNGLGTDADESVKEVFVQELVPIIWWFFTHCQVVDHNSEGPEPIEGITYLPSDAFTPLIGSLLLSANPRVGDGARLAIVELLNRLQGSEINAQDERYTTPSPDTQFGDGEKEIIISEIMNGVVLGMGRLDSEFQEAEQIARQEMALAAQRDGQRSGAPSPEDRQPHGDSPFLFEPSPIPDANPLPTGSQGYFDRSTRGTQIDSDGWVTAPPITPDEELHQLGSLAESSFSGENMLDSIPEEPAANDTSEEATVGRVASMSVVAAIAANATMPLHMQEVFVQEVWRVGSDPVYWVRREASFAIGALAKVVPQELITTYLLPLYENLVQDEQWHVRHSILFALPGILARIDPAQRRLLTVPSLVQLSRDPADPVRSGLLEVLGEVIYTFRDDPGGPPRELLNLFVATERHWTLEDAPYPSPNTFASHTWFSDPERPIICAFNFPAVILTLGPARWHELRDYYLHLTRSANPKVMRTLAASLGEVAAIIGPDATERDLVPVFLSFLKSAESDVRAKLIETAPKFAECLPETKREPTLSSLSSMWLDLGGWREREDLAKHFGELIVLAGENALLVVDLVSRGLRDEVAAVREAAVSSLPDVLKALRGRPELEKATTDLLLLAHDESYRRRVTFVASALSLVQAAASPSEVDLLVIWDPVSRLVRDPIVDIRIGVARLLAKTCELFYPDGENRPRYLQDGVDHLSNDESSQVRSYVEFLSSETVVTPPAVDNVNPARAFAIFSKPPRVTTHHADQDLESAVQDLTSAAEMMDIEEIREPARSAEMIPPQIIEPPQLEAVSSYPTRPVLVNADSSETVTSGSSRGDESQPSPIKREPEVPRGQSRRNVHMSLGELPVFVDYALDPRQAGSQAASTPSPGSERRVSFDAMSTHSDGSDSSGRLESVPLGRRVSMHRIPSDPTVSVSG